MIRQYLGIILSVAYALVIRLLGEWNVIEINSLSYLIVAPMALGFVPFYFGGKGFRTSWVKAVFFPLISVLLFLLIAVVTNLEDILCFIIIGAPYIVFSIIISVVLFSLNKEKKNEPNQKAWSVLLVPVLFGMIEKEFPKQKTTHLITHSVLIDQPDTLVWKNLFSVPDLTKSTVPGFINYLGVPQPLYSTYDPKTNIRLGYFENGVILNESVIESKSNVRLTFAIDSKQSFFGNSPTLQHVLVSGLVKFDYIRYELRKQGDGKTLLKLSTKYMIHSNLPLYGKFWSELIIKDFEQKLLGSFKRVLETTNK
jgi:hypothetical protein